MLYDLAPLTYILYFSKFVIILCSNVHSSVAVIAAGVKPCTVQYFAFTYSLSLRCEQVTLTYISASMILLLIYLVKYSPLHIAEIIKL